MKIPDSLRIGGVEYKIQIEENIRTSDEILYGQIDFDDSIIRISNTDGAGYQRQCVTMLHEALHGIIWHTVGELPENLEEEPLVECLAKGLYAFLQDNGGRIFDIKK